jgi:outer membrane receptor protein involved in Fe transport
VTLPQYSSFGAGGRFWTCGDQLCDGGYTVNSGGAVAPWDSLLYGYNRNGRRLIQVPTERYQFASKLSYDLTNDVSLFGEFYYTKTKSDSQLEAFPLANDDITGDTTIGVPLTNPYIPAALLNEATLNGATSIPFFRRITEIDDRTASNDRDTYRVALGAKGEFNKVRWDASYVRGEFKQSQKSTGDVSKARFLEALDAIDDGSGNIVCRSASARAAGCVPINLFGPGNISQEARDYVNAPSTRDATVTQDVLALNFSGDAFELPAGALGWAAGLEYRNEKSKSVQDFLTQTGGNTGNVTPNISGSYDVKEAFVELLIPVFKDLPWAQSANIEAAARVGDYSTVGQVFNWKVGGDYSPVEGLTFRAAFAQASRAPNVGELYDPGSEDFPTVVDVCNGVTATSNRPQDANCRAIPGMGQRIIDDGGQFTLTQTEQEGVRGFERGNPNLTEEKADTFTLGLVYQPSFIPRAALTLDYYNIQIDDAIAQVDQNYAVAQCYLTNNPVFCNTITRNNKGVIVRADAALANIAATKVEGIDASFAYQLPLEKLGWQTNATIDFDVKYNHEFKNATKAVPDAPEDDVAGYLGAVDAAGGPKDRATFGVLYRNDGWSFDWAMHYLGEVKLGSSSAPLNFPSTTVNGVKFTDSTINAWWSHDVQLRYDWEKYTLFIGSKNVFDKDPPIIGEGIPGVSTGTATASALYDVIGRTFYVGGKAKF